jgi:hypothetical protein
MHVSINCSTALELSRAVATDSFQPNNSSSGLATAVPVDATPSLLSAAVLSDVPHADNMATAASIARPLVICQD